MNVDLAGQLVGGTVIGVTGDPSICSMIEYMAHETGIGMVTRNAIWAATPTPLPGTAYRP